MVQSAQINYNFASKVNMKVIPAYGYVLAC